MIVECENCKMEYEYDAEAECYEPSECPSCGHYNYVLDWDEGGCKSSSDSVEYGDIICDY